MESAGISIDTAYALTATEKIEQRKKEIEAGIFAEVGEFNIAQVAMGRATRPILDVLGITHYTL